MTSYSYEVTNTTNSDHNYILNSLIFPIKAGSTIKIVTDSLITTMPLYFNIIPSDDNPVIPTAPVGDPSAYIAGDIISGDKPLMFIDSGIVVHADPAALDYVYAGISLSAAQLGGSVKTALFGNISADFWSWITGLPVFVNYASLSQTAPLSGRSHIVGWAVNSKTIYLSPDPAIRIK